MEEVAQELRLRGAYVELKSLRRKRDNSWGIWICWCIWAKTKLCLSDLAAAIFGAGLYLPARSGKSTYYRLETFLLEGSQATT